MTLSISAEPIPLSVDADGVLRVGGTRVTLDTVVVVFNQGATAEEIVFRYPCLQLADVYAVISFYFRHQQDIVRIQDVGLSGADDPTVLEWSAEEGRVLLTHDVSTVKSFVSVLTQSLPKRRIKFS